ncbi:UDP-galactopyranose mutase [Methylocystis echinoides]|uniref:UDP-galactopyranose mutase n=1 Tax=Methylocystis echinoides TaxID=29468 RepID=UPI00342FA888
MARYCVVGAGLSGAVVARALGEAGHAVLVVDERTRIGGNCATERDAATGIMAHLYGPHIFHTSDEAVWRYVQRFCTMMPYAHRVQAVARGRVYSLPINLLTINQFFHTTMSPSQARAFIQERAVNNLSPRNFQEQAHAMIGKELYEAFFEGYTRKQWGLEPVDLPASVLKRLPLRFDYDDSYFAHRYQGMPKDGYTPFIAAILDAPNVELRRETTFESLSESFEHVLYSGPIDRFFDFRLGRLNYRTLDFEKFHSPGDFQGTAVMNYCDAGVPFTRITEHKHFAPWEKQNFENTICYREYSRDCRPTDIPYYPIRQAKEQRLLQDYISLARETRGVSFIGRLGTYRYLDMDVTIGEALSAAGVVLECIAGGAAPPSFFIDPEH